MQLFLKAQVVLLASKGMERRKNFSEVYHKERQTKMSE